MDSEIRFLCLVSLAVIFITFAVMIQSSGG